MGEEELREIVNACLKDKRLMEIVERISNMTDGEKEIFKKKVNRYFFDKKSQEDLMAYRFYAIILTGDNARKIVEEVKKVNERK
ncbi:MAG: hypothetical protein DRP30_01560 [Thermotoga sp.]|nr:MAG: hypothetical protein DRP30_01560 [Thermotoga sp.]